MITREDVEMIDELLDRAPGCVRPGCSHESCQRALHARDAWSEARLLLLRMSEEGTEDDPPAEAV